MKQIEIEKLIDLSERGNSKTYITKDKKWVIKFASSDAGNTLEDYEKRQRNSKIAESLEIKTPKVGDIVVNKDGSYGLEYEYIEDKKSYARMVCENPEKVEEYMKDLAVFVKENHNKAVDKKSLLSIEEVVEKTMNENSDIFDETRKEKIKRTMSKIDNTGTFLHLDLQSGNYILSKKGTMIIDLDTICYGNPIYDLAFFYNIYHLLQKEHIEKISRCSVDLADKMWRFFIKHYKGFNTEKEIEEYNEYIKPYAFISSVAMLHTVKKEGPKRMFAEKFNQYIK